MNTISTTDFSGLTLFRRGKVRDVYDLGAHLLILATDRLSAFDVILPNPIPMKGAVLTNVSAFWFEKTRGICGNHFLTMDVSAYPDECEPHEEELAGRSMLVKKTEPLPIECVVRGYLAGSGWKEYKQSQAVCGIALPPGLVESAELPEPIFTPATKEESGHDVNISFERTADIVGIETASRVRELAFELYSFAREYARQRGIIIADTKFEFGFDGSEIILIDEALTPDSSRFWPASDYEPGRAQASYDKQFVRDYLESLNWDKAPPAPSLPPEVISKTTQKYLEAYRLLTGESLASPSELVQ